MATVETRVDASGEAPCASVHALMSSTKPHLLPIQEKGTSRRDPIARAGPCHGGAARGSPSSDPTEETSHPEMLPLNRFIASRHPRLAPQSKTLPQKTKLRSVIWETSQVLMSPYLCVRERACARAR